MLIWQKWCCVLPSTERACEGRRSMLKAQPRVHNQEGGRSDTAVAGSQLSKGAISGPIGPTSAHLGQMRNNTGLLSSLRFPSKDTLLLSFLKLLCPWLRGGYDSGISHPCFLILEVSTVLQDPVSILKLRENPIKLRTEDPISSSLLAGLLSY